MFFRGFVCLFTVGALALSWALPAHAMNKAELVDAIASSSGLSKADSKRALDGFINATSSALKKGDRISLHNFGAFGAVDRIADASGETSTGEVDFVAGRAFNDSEHAPAYSFKLEIEGAQDGAIHYPDSDGDGYGEPAVLAFGSGTGALKKGDRVTLMAGDEFVHEAEVMAALVHRSGGGGGGGGRIAVFRSSAGDDHTVWCWGDNSSNRQSQDANGSGGGAGGSVLVCAADGDARGVLLTGVRAGQLRPGMTIVKMSAPPLHEERPRAGTNPLYERASGQVGGGIVDDMAVIEMIMRETGLGERTVIAAYNALLNIIVDEVNAGGFVDLAGFGRFGTEVVATVQIVDPCAGDPEACLQDIDDPELLRELLANDFVEHEVSVAVSEGDIEEVTREASSISKRSARTGRNPQTGKEIKIAAKNVVKFKAGAELSKSVN